jgi:hypothetical protein
VAADQNYAAKMPKSKGWHLDGGFEYPNQFTGTLKDGNDFRAMRDIPVYAFRNANAPVTGVAGKGGALTLTPPKNAFDFVDNYVATFNEARASFEMKFITELRRWTQKPKSEEIGHYTWGFQIDSNPFKVEMELPEWHRLK